MAFFISLLSDRKLSLFLQFLIEIIRLHRYDRGRNGNDEEGA